MSEYFNRTANYPITRTAALSAAMRAELDAVETGFQKLPVLSTGATQGLFINAGGTAMVSTPALTLSSGGLNMGGATQVLLPTISSSDNSQKAAASAWVRTYVTAAIGQAAALSLPPLGVDLDEFLSHDSTSVFWSRVPGARATAVVAPVVLTTASNGLQQITSTDHGATVTLPDATLLGPSGVARFMLDNQGDYWVSIVDAGGTTRGFLAPRESTSVFLADNSTAAGTWSLPGARLLGMDAAKAFALGPTTSLAGVAQLTDTLSVLLLRDSITSYAVAYDEVTRTFGAATTVRAPGFVFSSRIQRASNTQAVVCSLQDSNTSLEAVVLTVSGTSISVGTAATATLAASGNIQDFVTLSAGATYVVSTSAATDNVRAIGVSGTAAYISSGGITAGCRALHPINATTVVGEDTPGGTSNYVRRFTVAGGAAPSIGSMATSTVTTATAASATCYGFHLLGSGRVAYLLWDDTANFDVYAAIVDPTTMSSVSAVVLHSLSSGAAIFLSQVYGSQVLCAALPSTAAGSVNVLTDSGGTAVVGTEIRPTYVLSTAIPSSYKLIGCNTAGIVLVTNGYTVKLGISGNNPTLALLGGSSLVVNNSTFSSSGKTMAADAVLSGAVSVPPGVTQSNEVAAVTPALGVVQVPDFMLRGSSTAAAEARAANTDPWYWSLSNSRVSTLTLLRVRVAQ